MRRKFFSLLSVAVVIASPALASEPKRIPGLVTEADVGRFIRDQNGDPIGSLHAIHGDQAVVWYGFVNTPGNHLTMVPLNAIIAVDGRLVLPKDRVSQLAAR